MKEEPSMIDRLFFVVTAILSLVLGTACAKGEAEGGASTSYDYARNYVEGYTTYIMSVWKAPLLASPGRWEEWEKDPGFIQVLGELERRCIDLSLGAWDAKAHRDGRDAAGAGDECRHLSSEAKAAIAYTIKRMKSSQAGTDGLREMAASHALTEYQGVLKILIDEYPNTVDPRATFPNMLPAMRGKYRSPPAGAKCNGEGSYDDCRTQPTHVFQVTKIDARQEKTIYLCDGHATGIESPEAKRELGRQRTVVERQ